MSRTHAVVAEPVPTVSEPTRAAIVALAGIALVPLLLGGFVPGLGISVALACAAAWRPRAEPLLAPSTATRQFALLLMAALAWSAVTLLPLPLRLHQWLAPGATALDLALGGDANAVSLSRDPAATRLALLALALGASVVAAVRHVGRTARARALLQGALIASASAVALLGIVETFLGEPLLQRGLPAHARPFGPFANRNHAGVLLVLALPLALAAARRASQSQRRAAGCAATGASVMLLLGLLVNGSRGAALAALLVTLFSLLFARGRRGAKLLLSGAVIAALVLPGAAFARRGDATTIAERVTLAGDALRMAGDSPLLGIGLGAFGSAYPPYQTVPRDLRFRHVECEPLELLVEGGVPLLLLALLALALLLRVATRVLASPRLDDAALAASALAVPFHAWCDFPLRIPGVALPFAMSVGLLLAVHDAASEGAR